MRLGVLGSPDSWYLRDLIRAGGDDHEVVPVTFSCIASSLNGAMKASSGGLDLTSFDAVLVRTMPPGSLEQVVFRMDVLACLQASGVPVFNPPKSLEIAIDKYLASARLAAAGLTIPRTVTTQTADEAMTAFAELGGDVVVKPLFGAEGRGITRLNDEALALRAFKMLEQFGAVIYLQEFIPHAGADLRLMVMGNEVLGMQRSNPDDWRTNVSRGATTQPLPVTDQLAELAHRAAAAVGAPMAGVDILPGNDGVFYALEVNAAPGWKALARCLKIDVARRVLDFVDHAVSQHA